VGVVGFEPTQSKTTDLQSAPALQLRRTPNYSINENRADEGIRTPDPEITNHVLWPAELHRQNHEKMNKRCKKKHPLISKGVQM
jgi:hypothetical protein